MKVSKYPVGMIWMILVVSVCSVPGGQISGFENQPREQSCFLKKRHSPIQIRPPPLL